MEIWKSTVGFEGIYEDSNYGRVRSIDRVIHDGRNLKGRVLKQGGGTNGYLGVTLSKLGKIYAKSVHRLVATNHVNGYFEGAVVNHIDGDKLNCSVDNLEWCTPKENSQHAVKLGLLQKPSLLSKILNGEAKLNIEQISDLINNYKPFSKSKGLKYFSDKYKVDRGTLRSYLNLFK